MAIKRIFINPGDTLDIRFIDDPDAPKNNKEWEYQVRPYRMLLELRKSEIRFCDPLYLAILTDMRGNAKKYLQ